MQTPTTIVASRTKRKAITTARWTTTKRSVSTLITHLYGSRGSAYFAQSNLTAAIADYEHTISAAPSSRAAVYAVLMLHVIMTRQGHDDAQQLALVAAAADRRNGLGRC